MAYMSQGKKAKIAPKVKAILSKYKVKGSLAVRNHSTLVLNIKQGPIDFIANFNAANGSDPYQVAHGFRPVTNHIDVNPYHFRDHFTGKTLMFLREVHAAMMDGNHDNSNIQVDYFDVGWYVDINIGQWNKPYVKV